MTHQSISNRGVNILQFSLKQRSNTVVGREIKSKKPIAYLDLRYGRIEVFLNIKVKYVKTFYFPQKLLTAEGGERVTLKFPRVIPVG